MTAAGRRAGRGNVRSARPAVLQGESKAARIAANVATAIVAGRAAGRAAALAGRTAIRAATHAAVPVAIPVLIRAATVATAVAGIAVRSVASSPCSAAVAGAAPTVASDIGAISTAIRPTARIRATVTATIRAAAAAVAAAETMTVAGIRTAATIRMAADAATAAVPAARVTSMPTAARSMARQCPTKTSSRRPIAWSVRRRLRPTSPIRLQGSECSRHTPCAVRSAQRTPAEQTAHGVCLLRRAARLRPSSARIARGRPACEVDCRPIPLLDQQELLRIAAHGDHQPAAGGKLRHQRLRHVVRRGAHHDHVEGRVFGPSLVAVAAADGDVLVAQCGQPLRAAVAKGSWISTPYTSWHNSARTAA